MQEYITLSQMWDVKLIPFIKAKFQMKKTLLIKAYQVVDYDYLVM
jgi:hypothetical protein